MISTLFKDMAKAPVKMILTLLTVALGTGLLMLSLSVSGFLERTVQEKLATEGVILSYTNGTWDGDSLDKERPPVTDAHILDYLEQELDGFVGGAPIIKGDWDSVKAGDSSWTIRTAIGTTPDYQEIMGLEMTEGIFFTQEQSDKGSKVAVISQSLAEQLYGSAADAIGQSFTPPETTFRRGPGEGDSKRGVNIYQVVGVFEDRDELFRRSYQVGDMIVPLASLLPQGVEVSRMLGYMYATGVFKVDGMSKEKAAAQAGMILSMAYGEDTEMYFWEGDLEGESSSLDEIRTTLNTFTVVIGMMGFILLITSSIGILSIMMVDALGRSREIALKRALGASQWTILREYFLKSLTLSGLCALVGLIVALIFIAPFAELVTPLFAGLSLDSLDRPGVTFSAIMTAFLTALLAGGVLGTLPLFSLMKGVISESIREG
ncbi:MAG: ABC transporter permease [Spirochaetales bacterium]|nr:ABC transporter permease [Spirochaetales bacterium]